MCSDRVFDFFQWFIWNMNLWQNINWLWLSHGNNLWIVLNFDVPLRSLRSKLLAWGCPHWGISHSIKSSILSSDLINLSIIISIQRFNFVENDFDFVTSIQHSLYTACVVTFINRKTCWSIFWVSFETYAFSKHTRFTRLIIIWRGFLSNSNTSATEQITTCC